MYLNKFKMFKKKRIISVITARKGSTRIKNKNLKLFCNKPLVYWSILVSKKSKFIDKTFVSSDDPKILKLAKKMKCETVLRSKKLSNNTIMPDFAVIDVLKKFGKPNDIVIFLQPTSPLRLITDIDNAIKKFVNTKCDSLLSVNKFNDFKFIWKKEKNSKFFSPVNYSFKKRPMSQKLSQFFENGSLYVTYSKKFLKSKNRLMGKKQIYEMKDWQASEIDTIADFKRCENIFKKKIKVK
mgnify:CR=1 FL=1